MYALKRRAFAFALAGVFAVAVLPSTSDAAPSFTGKWNFVATMLSGGVHTNVATVCTLQQTGACAGVTGGGPANGTTNANTIQLQVHSVPSTGFLSVLTFRGTLAATTQMRGTWTISTRPGGSGTFNAVRS
jgi:hypothetical protein